MSLFQASAFELLCLLAAFAFSREQQVYKVPADLLPKWQKVSQSRAIQPRCTDAPDWVTTSAIEATFLGIVTVLILSGTVASWHPAGATLAEGLSGTLSCNPALKTWVETKMSPFIRIYESSFVTFEFFLFKRTEICLIANAQFLIWKF